MVWMVWASIAGAIGGLVAAAVPEGALLLPKWVAAASKLYVGFLGEMLVGAVAAPAAVYFTVAAAQGTPTVPAAIAIGLIAGFSGRSVLDRLAAERLNAAVRNRILSDEKSVVGSGRIGGEIEDGGGSLASGANEAAATDERAG